MTSWFDQRERDCMRLAGGDGKVTGGVGDTLLMPHGEIGPGRTLDK